MDKVSSLDFLMKGGVLVNKPLEGCYPGQAEIW